MAGVDHWSIRHHAGVPNHVFQFTDVAGPVVSRKYVLRAAADTANVFAVFSGKLLDEVSLQEWQIFLAFGKRGKFHVYDREPIVEVLAKPPLTNFLLQVAVGCGHNRSEERRVGKE